MTTHQRDAYTMLAQRWLHHEQLRSAGVPVSTLFESRRRLDEARRKARSAA